ncbi:hypothetical protein EVAR_74540_1 [Eumeta japonica]|uniref:Uncharacterized protein n=1 Tax=Eumeta variegata TaxID=151549 RepID=A0A4C1TBL7_EUMVA|nr:hypothetical protein EVAR_74540_1 [Eumeta japonica]
MSRRRVLLCVNYSSELSPRACFAIFWDEGVQRKRRRYFSRALPSSGGGGPEPSEAGPICVIQHSIKARYVYFVYFESFMRCGQTRAHPHAKTRGLEMCEQSACPYSNIYIDNRLLAVAFIDGRRYHSADKVDGASRRVLGPREAPAPAPRPLSLENSIRVRLNVKYLR